MRERGGCSRVRFKLLRDCEILLRVALVLRSHFVERK
jgi:hypothetical protein